MVTYCFVEDKKKLLAEAMMRGFTAIRDWPRFTKTLADAQEACVALRCEVCCIEDDENAYRHMVETAWTHAYASLQDVIDRDAVYMVLTLKDLPFEGAIVFIREAFSHGEGPAEVDKAYARYLAMIATS